MEEKPENRSRGEEGSEEREGSKILKAKERKEIRKKAKQLNKTKNESYKHC